MAAMMDGHGGYLPVLSGSSSRNSPKSFSEGILIFYTSGKAPGKSLHVHIFLYKFLIKMILVEQKRCNF